jgi:predicted dehydrogenase
MKPYDRPIRIGLIGAGYIAAVHSAAYRVVAGTFPADVPPVELVRVVDSDAHRAAGLAAAWGWTEVADEIEAVTRAADIDVVDICAPNDVHAVVAIEALHHGKHVVCEKPLAADVTQAREMAAAARGAGRVAQVCFYYRTWPAIAHARRLIDGGAIGRVVGFRGRMLQDYAADPGFALGWRATPEGGAGALDDLGSHILDVARFLAGDMRVLDGATWSTVNRPGPALVDAASARVEFASGASGVVEASWAARGHGCDLGFEVEGDEGTIHFGWERANELHVRSRGSADFERLLVGPAMPGAEAFLGVSGQQMGYRDAFTLGLGRLLSAIAAGERSCAPTFDDGLRVAELVAAIRASAMAAGSR